MDASTLKKRIVEEFQTYTDAAANLVRAARIPQPGSQKTMSASGEMMDIYSEKIITSCRTLQAIQADLKRNAFLNDIEARNTENLSGRHEMDGRLKHGVELEKLQDHPSSKHGGGS